MSSIDLADDREPVGADGLCAPPLGRRPLTAPAPVARCLFGVSGFVDRRRGRPTEATGAAVDYFLRTGTYSIARAERLLGYQPTVDLAEGMDRTETWLGDHGYL